MAAISHPLTLFLVLFAQKSWIVQKCENIYEELSPDGYYMGKDMEA